ncbi:type I 3-dehydroquinate dehydratase [Halomarina oriensis]|uniref:3-dehydroquinate dehydratase n=1 Tax=Halomarina oriensis TaxID=671145 RepID=A0A6B0GL12_9EURY|nr:type I 3-dehydroquinate dehydratase [Halomarina oriensis]MWG35616.1 type I 3-dehydroquinate dehydratase [Halomarina oriensis]
MNFDDFVLAASTADLGEEPAARDHADAVEFRMDAASDPLGALDDYDGTLPILATNRVEWEGGEAPDDEDRLVELAVAAEHPSVEAVDVELAAVVGARNDDALWAVAHAREHGASVVVSIHDFEETPSRAECARLLDQAHEFGDVAKLAVTAESREDVLRLLALTNAQTAAGERVATMAMGAVGRHSRAVAPVYGSCLGYAPVAAERATAPGQYDLGTLRGLVDRLR